MKKIHILTNIPTPYRNHFFNLLSTAGKEKNLDVHVYFMATTEQGRFWNYKEWEMKYSYDFLYNLGIKWKGIKFHFNPTILIKILRNKPDILIVSGSWNFPTSMMVAFLKFLYPSVKLGFWSEGNFTYETYSSKGVVRLLKKMIYNKFDFLVSSGQKSDEMIRYYVENPKIVRLVNIINEYSFSSFVHQEFKLPLVIFIASKLNQRKNVYFFLESVLELIRTRRLIVRIAGTGEDFNLIKDWIAQHHLEYGINMLGQISEQHIISELQNCHVFCLPSLREPFPLSIIEAMFMSKPLLLSANIGSLPEVLNQNGITFIPTDKEDILNKTKWMCDRSAEEIREMETHSRLQAINVFSSDRVTKHFVEDLLGV